MRFLLAVLAGFVTNVVSYILVVGWTGGPPSGLAMIVINWTYERLMGVFGHPFATFAITLALTVPGLLVAVFVHRALAKHALADGECRCRKCGYILRGLSEPRCPECGERL